MEVEIKSALEELKSKTAEQLEGAIKKYDGQIQEYGVAQGEIKSEVKQLSEQFADLQATVISVAQKQDSAYVGETRAMTAGEEFIKSAAYRDLVEGRTQRARVEVKNTVLADPTTTFPLQRPGVISGDFAPVTVRSLFRVIPVTTNVVASLREESWVSSAAEVSQGSAKPESDITFEQYDVNIKTVAHFLKVTNQLLADAPAVVAYIETRARDGLAQRIDAQLLNGNGTSPNLSGLTDSGNFTAYVGASNDNLVDAINRAKYQLWAIGYMPDTVIVNPADWGAMERERESGPGMYLYGPPGTAAGVNPFGVRVVMSNHMSSGYFWIGNIDQAAVLYARSGAVVELGYVNDDFTRNLVTIRVEERLGLGVEKPSAALYGEFAG